MSDVLSLEKHRDLFKDDEAVRKFAKVLEEATAASEMRLLLFDERIVGAIVSTAEAQDRLRQRIVTRLARDQASLETLKDRLESDDLVQ